MQDTADCYTFYVLILGVPEDAFWHCDCAWVRKIAENMTAYNGWRAWVQEKQREEAERRAR